MTAFMLDDYVQSLKRVFCNRERPVTRQTVEPSDMMELHDGWVGHAS
jgi:hypothetical protein